MFAYNYWDFVAFNIVTFLLSITLIFDKFVNESLINNKGNSMYCVTLCSTVILLGVALLKPLSISYYLDEHDSSLVAIVSDAYIKNTFPHIYTQGGYTRVSKKSRNEYVFSKQFESEVSFTFSNDVRTWKITEWTYMAHVEVDCGFYIWKSSCSSPADYHVRTAQVSKDILETPVL
jgi:hypothetical protein